MTQFAPQYPAPTQAYPQQPQYAPAQPQYAPAQPQYAPQQYPMAQGYPQPQMAPTPPPLAQGSLDDFFSQPSAGGGKSLSFKTIGQRIIGIVSRPISQGDIQQQTDTMGRPQTFRDGRPKFVMKVPLQMQPSAEYPDGVGVWYVKGQARDELVRAMSAVDAPSGPPEAGALIDVTYLADRQAGPGMNPAKQMQVVYTRPDSANGAAPQQPLPQAPPQPQYAQPAQQQPLPQAPQQPLPQAPQQPQYAQPAQQFTQAPAQYAQPQAPAQYAQPAQPGPAANVPDGLTPDQQALFLQLTQTQNR